MMTEQTLLEELRKAKEYAIENGGELRGQYANEPIWLSSDGQVLGHGRDEIIDGKLRPIEQRPAPEGRIVLYGAIDQLVTGGVPLSELR